MKLGLGLALVVIAASPPARAQDASKLEEPAPEKLPLRAKVKECCGYPIGLKQQFHLSFYWLAYESEYALEDYDTDIYNRRGMFLGRFPKAFVFELTLEGSGVLRDGRILNYDGECAYGVGTCFRTLKLAEHPLGAGAQGRPLEPFRSIAVDPHYIPIGSPIYLPELAGLKLPDGTVHDGCLRADDVGGSIRRHKIDFFVESYFNYKYLADSLWWQLKANPLIEEPRCEYLRLHEPLELANDHTDWAELHRHYGRLRMAERVALAKIKRNRRLEQAWLKRHSTSGARAASPARHHTQPTGHAQVARRR